MPKFEACPDDTKAEVVVPLGRLTLAHFGEALGKVERMAAAVQAPADAEVSFDSFSGDEVKARIRWTVAP